MAPCPTNPTAAANRDGAESPPPRAAFDSHPSDLALIETLLRPWVASGRKPAADYVHEHDVYAAGPTELARTFAPAVAQDGERAWYFLTRLRLKSVHGRGKRIDRTVATRRGWWHGEARVRPVVDGLAGREAGLRQALSFMADQRGARVRTGWIMAELRLDAALEEGTPVLCKVYRSPRWRPAVDGPGDDDGDASPPKQPAPPPPAAREGDAADDDQSSSAATTASPAPNRAAAADGEIFGGAAAAPARGRKEKDAEGSAETSAAAPERERHRAADDEQSSSATRKRHLVAADDDESPDAARKKMRKADDGLNSSPDDAASIIKLHCPQCGCGFHVEAAPAQVGVAPAKSESETGVVLVAAPQQGGETGGDSSPTKDHAFYHFL